MKCRFVLGLDEGHPWIMSVADDCDRVISQSQSRAVEVTCWAGVFNPFDLTVLRAAWWQARANNLGSNVGGASAPS